MVVTNEQKKKAEGIVRKRGLDFVVLFGSQKNGKTHKKSDLDIGVMDNQKVEYRRFGTLFNDFSQLFQGQNVDLRFIKGSEPVFLYNALMKGEFIAGNLHSFYNYKAFAYKNYVDSKSLFELKDKILARRQKKLNKRIK